MKYVSYYLSQISNNKRVEVLQCVLMYAGLSFEGWVPGIFLGYDKCDSSLLSWLNRRKTKPKEIHCWLISHQHVVFTLQLEILVTAVLWLWDFELSIGLDVLLGEVDNTLRQDWKGLVKRENKDKIVNEQLPFVRKTWWFQGEFKWNGSSQWKFSRKEVIPFKVLPFLHIYQNDWKSLHHLSALTICMEKPVIPARIKMEWFILVEIFWKRINTFRGLPFSRFYRNDKNFLYPLSGKPVSGFLLRRMVICFNRGPLVIWCFANGTTLTHSSFRNHFQVQYHLSEIFHQNFITNGKHSIFLTFYSKWEKTGTFY